MSHHPQAPSLRAALMPAGSCSLYLWLTWLLLSWSVLHGLPKDPPPTLLSSAPPKPSVGAQPLPSSPMEL